MKSKAFRSASVLGTIALSLSIGLSSCASQNNSSKDIQPQKNIHTKTAQSPEKLEGNDTRLPTPSGTQTLGQEFSCQNLQSRFSLSDYQLDEVFSPETSTPEWRAVNSGGTACIWKDSSGSKWISASLEKIAPEDFRDFAESQRSFSTPAKFGSTNDSLEFFSFDGSTSSARVLNNTYLITTRSNSLTNENELGQLAHKSELLLLGK